ncbi:MAG: hypothetical protein VX252_05060 [Myxococcota bacterium]|nr:hypothetical protein [Myxococcota bacterium]
MKETRGARAGTSTDPQARSSDGTFFRRLQSGSLRAGAVTLLVFALSAMLSSCAVREQVRRICIDVEASEDLNFYDGKTHTLTLLVYALSDGAGFKATPVSELLSGHRPSGVLEPPVPFTVEPATKTRLEEVFPAATRSVGILADYDREPGEADEGSGILGRRVVLPARCGFMTPRLKLLESRIEGN